MGNGVTIFRVKLNKGVKLNNSKKDNIEGCVFCDWTIGFQKFIYLNYLITFRYSIGKGNGTSGISVMQVANNYTLHSKIFIIELT